MSADTFAVELDVFSGPFEVLLNMIARRKLDITEVALSQVTDEFLAFVAAQDRTDLEHMSEFLVVAATLLEMKTLRLLPRNEVAEEDLELLEARDLLFAKLLQYRAYKEVAADMAVRLAQESLRYGRAATLEPELRNILPEVQLTLTVQELAILAAQAIYAPPQQVPLAHLHDPIVPVSSQVSLLRSRLVLGDPISFTQLCRDAGNLPTVVSRFLAVLEMLRNGEVAVSQESPLAPLNIKKVRESDD